MILVAVGANLPAGSGTTPLATCRQAVEALRLIPGLRVAAVSRWYETDPVPPSGQPPYVNGVVRLAGRIDPAALLHALHAIEDGHGRRRGERNAARTLDLDVIAMDDPDTASDDGALVRTAPDPVVPHPRTHLRGFVLEPLRDVAPGWRHPVLHESAETLLAGLPPQGVRRIGEEAGEVEAPPQAPPKASLWNPIA